MREELLHPMFVHFPIALFFIASFAKLLEIVANKKVPAIKYHMEILFKYLIILGSLFFIIALFLGDSALDIIKNDFCDLTSVYRHENLSYYALYFYMGALIFMAISYLEKFEKHLAAFNYLILFFLLGGDFYLYKTAKLGGELVYEKGAAVKVATRDCKKN